MEKRLLFLDLDGTLLNDQKQITPGNVAALRSALERGHGVIITTGRPLHSAMAQARKLSLDKPGCYLIAYNGGILYDWQTEQELHRQELDMDTVYTVFDQANARGIHIQTYDSRNVLVERCCDDGDIRRYCSLTHSEFRVLEDIRTGLTERPVKILMSNYRDKSPLLCMEEWLNRELISRMDCFFSCEQFLEVAPKGTNKGEAVKMLCRKLNVPVAHAVAVGDAANDLSMILTAGTGVAMANGADQVKAAADYITHRDNNHDGVAEVVERFLGEPVC